MALLQEQRSSGPAFFSSSSSTSPDNEASLSLSPSHRDHGWQSMSRFDRLRRWNTTNSDQSGSVARGMRKRWWKSQKVDG